MINTVENNDSNLYIKNNFNGVFLRDLLLGLNDKFKNTIFWVNNFSSGDVLVNIPLYYHFSKDVRFSLDAFVDDTPDIRVEGSTTTIHKGLIDFNSWAIMVDKYANPNVYLTTIKETDDELIQSQTLTKQVPIKLTCSLEIGLDSEIEVFKCWEGLLRAFFPYKYFKFTYNKIKYDAQVFMSFDTENPFPKKVTFGTVEQLTYKVTFEIHTFYPIFDNEFLADNIKVNWLNDIYSVNNIPSKKSII